MPATRGFRAIETMTLTPFLNVGVNFNSPPVIGELKFKVGGAPAGI